MIIRKYADDFVSDCLECCETYPYIMVLDGINEDFKICKYCLLEALEAFELFEK